MILMRILNQLNSDKLSSQFVRISCQLFSKKDMAFVMTEELSLLHIIVLSLKNMIKEVLIPCKLHDESGNRHQVVDNSKHVLKNNCYW